MPMNWILPYKGGMSKWQEKAESKLQSKSRLSNQGTSLNVKHLAASPVGMKVTCNTTLVEVDKRRLVFSVEVEDETGKVGEGTHERFIVQAEKFQNKADAKLNR